MTPDERKAARARCQAARPGPWSWESLYDRGAGICDDEYALLDGKGDVLFEPGITSISGRLVLQLESGFAPPIPEHVFAFIAHARCDLPAALDELDRLEALLRRHGIDPTETPSEET